MQDYIFRNDGLESGILPKCQQVDPINVKYPTVKGIQKMTQSVGGEICPFQRGDQGVCQYQQAQTQDLSVIGLEGTGVASYPEKGKVAELTQIIALIVGCAREILGLITGARKYRTV